MKKDDLFKKYWFVILIAIFFLCFIIYYIYGLVNSNKPSVESKTVDGKAVVYSIDDQNFFADDLYETLFNVSGINLAYENYKAEIVSKAIKADSEMETYAANYAAYMLQNYDEATLLSYLKQYGYTKIDDLSTFYLNQLKESEFISNYFEDNYDSIVKPLVDENNPRLISHILVKVADVEEITDEDGNVTHVAHPTDEEQAKIDEILSALKEREFADVAMEYSEDGSAASGGLLGVVGEFNANNYVPEFAQESMRLNLGEVSELITTTYGYHIILAQEANVEDLLADQSFYALITNNNPGLINKAIEEKGKELGFEVVDENVKAGFDALLESEGE